MHTLLFIDDSEKIEVLIGIILFAIMIAIFWKKKVDVSTNEVNAFIDHRFSAQDFYSRLRELIEDRNMPDVKIGRVSFPISSMLSDKREYLRVVRKDSVFDICAAPFGTGSFVSYWFGEPRKTLKQLARRVAVTYIKNPDVHQIIDSFNTKTRYQYDVDAIFRVWVKDCIKQAIEEMKESKGVRTPLETV
jgi:hypothetical protein